MSEGSTGGTEDITVRVDHELCSGTGYCAEKYSEIFELRDDDKSWVRDGVDWSNVDHPRLDEARDACPWAAIAVERARGQAGVSP